MSFDRLRKLVALAREHDPNLYAWLADALADHRDGMPLERALCLSGPRAVRFRDEALAEAAELIDPPGNLSNWGRAGALANRIPSFERIVWPRYIDHPDADSRGVNRALLAAFRSGAHIPKTQRYLYEILKNHSVNFSSTALQYNYAIGGHHADDPETGYSKTSSTNSGAPPAP